MFFATVIAAPVLAGLVAGVLTDRRSAPWALTGICLVLGGIGAVLTGVDADTTDRASSVAFSLLAGVAASGLVWAGYAAGRLTRRPPKTA